MCAFVQNIAMTEESQTSSHGSTQEIRIAVAVTTADDPAQAAMATTTLEDNPTFELRIFGCRISSVLDFPPSTPMMGVPVLLLEQYVRNKWTEIEQV